MRVASSPPGNPATTTSPSLRPTARTLPSGLQAAAGTAVSPPGNGRDRSASRSQSVLLSIPGLADDHGFRDQVASARMEDEAPGP